MAIAFVPTKVDDSLSWFIKEKMIGMDAYVESEFNDMFNREHHTYIHINEHGTIDAFGMVHKPDDIWLFGYTWHDGSRGGRVAFLRGLKMLMETYGAIGIQEHNLHVNKIKRLMEGY
ncbi:hypothetical protein CRP143_gp30 [Roseobacter phage CRP-143]|nr:hypothetical protein CRP143_gp30 [Roseobacter phage CRP-143]